eukprot:XP_014617373.1 E3 ubiquitin-protein ligase UPL6 [Glycine max]
MCNEHELQLLTSGSLDSLDVDLRQRTNYAGGYHSVRFVTGCSRGPLLGFQYLEPLFFIQRAGGNDPEEALDRLPSSATCMNLLKL